MEIEDVAQVVVRRVQELLVGQSHGLELLVVALGARAHVLVEGPPGTAKTLLASAVAQSVGLRFRRLQLTPDLVPADVLGTSIWQPQSAAFAFRPGPVFTDVLLADELNRAPPKTQAALLEAMQERQVTLDGTSRPLSDQFWVVATQNPLEQEGTFPLPDSQLDRFALRVTLDYPSPAEERAVLLGHRDRGDPLARLREETPPVVDPATLAAWQGRVERVHISDPVVDYIQALTRATRAQPELAIGAGPRAGVWLLRCSRALALVRRRSYVIPDDVRDLAGAALEHRLRLGPEAQLAGVSVRALLGRILASVAVPSAHAPAPTAVAS